MIRYETLFLSLSLSFDSVCVHTNGISRHIFLYIYVSVQASWTKYMNPLRLKASFMCGAFSGRWKQATILPCMASHTNIHHNAFHYIEFIMSHRHTFPINILWWVTFIFIRCFHWNYFWLDSEELTKHHWHWYNTIFLLKWICWTEIVDWKKNVIICESQKINNKRHVLCIKEANDSLYDWNVEKVISKLVLPSTC